MSQSKQILKEQFVEHFLFDYTDKDEFEVQMLSEIFEGIYYQKDKHFKPESKYWQVFRCLESQQAKIDELKAEKMELERACESYKNQRDDYAEKLLKKSIHYESAKNEIVGLKDRLELANHIASQSTWSPLKQLRKVAKALRGIND